MLQGMITSTPMTQPDDQPIIWRSYPAWSQFTWLYLLSTLAALRGALYLSFGVPGSWAWFTGAWFLLVCVILVRRWACYVITPNKVAIRNGYSGRETEAIAHREIQSVTVHQGPIAGFFGIGTLMIYATDGERWIRFRGIKDPEIVQKRVEALKPVPASA